MTTPPPTPSPKTAGHMGALPHARYNDWVEAFMTHQDLNHRSRAPRIAAIAAGAGVAVAAGAIAGIGAALCSIVFDTAYPNSTFARKRTDRLRHHDPLAQYRDEAGNAWFAQSGQPVSLRTYDGLTLRGWRFDPDTARPAAHCYAICVHGYTGEPAEMAPWAHHYARRGFTVIVPAQRGHGDSEGRFVTMGHMEHRDLMQWVNAIVARDPQARILLDGNSMGAATVLLACADPRLAPNVVAAVADSAYTNVASQLEMTVSSLLHAPAWTAKPVVAWASLWNRLRLGFGFHDVSPLNAVRHMHIPVLFIHGMDDTIVSPRCARELYEACASNDAALLEVPGAVHTAEFAVDPQRYWRTVDAFIDRLFPLH